MRLPCIFCQVHAAGAAFDHGNADLGVRLLELPFSSALDDVAAFRTKARAGRPCFTRRALLHRPSRLRVPL